MEIKIYGLNNGKYSLINDELYFEFKNKNDLVIDKESALEIMHTLLDSLDLLNKDTEELIYKVEEKLNGNN